MAAILSEPQYVNLSGADVRMSWENYINCWWPDSFPQQVIIIMDVYCRQVYNIRRTLVGN